MPKKLPRDIVTATEHSPRLRADIVSLSDKAKKKRKRKSLEEKVAAKQRAIRKRDRQPASAAVKRGVMSMRSIDRQIREKQARVAELRLKARAVERSGTGNVKAAATYRKAASVVMQQIAALRKRRK